MSSHHFVKEDQEPALIILRHDTILLEKVQPLLEWSPLVIVSQYALEKVLSWGIKIDVLLMSTTPEEFEQVILDQSPLLVLQRKEEQSELGLVLHFLINRNQFNVNVIAADVKDHFSIASSFAEKIKMVFVDGKCRWHFVAQGTYSKWLPVKANLHIFNDNRIEQIDIAETGIYKHKRTTPFWVGEEL